MAGCQSKHTAIKDDKVTLSEQIASNKQYNGMSSMNDPMPVINI